MRFTILHCRNFECMQRVWVPEQKLGLRGRCPECGHPMNTPVEVPLDEMFEGPPIMLDLEESPMPVTIA